MRKFLHIYSIVTLGGGFILVVVFGFGIDTSRTVHVATAEEILLQPTHELSPTPTEQLSPSPSPSPSSTPTPAFSCCEHDIKVNQVQAVPQKTAQGVGTIAVTIDYKLDIHWRCDKVPEDDCLAFYEITLENSNWQEFKGGAWVDIADANVNESIIPDPPLKTKCDGKTHKGTWNYSYIATITTANPIRNTSLVFDWDIPKMKGTSYHSEYQVSGISPTTGTKPPTVHGSHPKKK